jgi:drug/metabolite transporter (DMT)-like permease
LPFRESPRLRDTRSLTLRTWLILAACQTVWAGSYVAMKFAGAELPVGAVVTLRFGLASLLFLPLVLRGGWPRIERRDWALIAALGALNFTISPSLQVASLHYTQAIDLSILVALEPISTVLLAALVLREPLGPRTLAAGAMALAGALVLSGAWAPGAEVTRERLIGNGMYIAASLCEVSVTLAGGRLARRYDPLAAIGLMKMAGFVAAAILYAGVWDDVDFEAVSGRAWGSIVYLGAAASVFGYGVWYWVLREVPVSEAALSLFLQPVAGTFFGYALAAERIGWNTGVGGALILGALAWQQAVRRARTA